MKCLDVCALQLLAAALYSVAWLASADDGPTGVVSREQRRELTPLEVFEKLREQQNTEPTPTVSHEMEDEYEKELDGNVTAQLLRTNRENGKSPKASLLRVAFVYGEQQRRQQHRSSSRLCESEMLNQTCRHGKKRYYCSSLMSALDTDLQGWRWEERRSRSCVDLHINGSVLVGGKDDVPDVCFAELWLPNTVACRLILNATDAPAADCLLNASTLPQGDFVAKSNGVTTRLRLDEKSKTNSLAGRWLRLDIPPHISLDTHSQSTQDPESISPSGRDIAINASLRLCFRPTRRQRTTSGRARRKHTPTAKLMRLHKPSPGTRVDDIIEAPFVMVGIHASGKNLMLFRWGGNHTTDNTAVSPSVGTSAPPDEHPVTPLAS